MDCLCRLLTARVLIDDVIALHFCDINQSASDPCDLHVQHMLLQHFFQGVLRTQQQATIR